MPSEARMLRRVRLGPLLVRGAKWRLPCMVSYLVFTCVERRNLNAAAAIAANTDPTSLHAVDAFDFLSVCIFALSQLARAGPTNLGLVFAGWCKRTWPKSPETIMAFRGRPDDVGLEPTAPHDEEDGTDRADGDGHVGVVGAGKKNTRLAPVFALLILLYLFVCPFFFLCCTLFGFVAAPRRPRC